MKNATYKIAVLSDLKNASIAELKSTISLAKIINAEVNFFHVKSSTELINKESQLSALRSINDSYKKTESKLNKLKKRYKEEHNITINYSYTIGNVKKEISTFLQNTKPDIVVLGKKRKKVLKFIGDNITGFILKKHSGPILIADNKNGLDPNKNLSLGSLNNSNELLNFGFEKDLINNCKKPLKYFQIGETNKNLKSDKEGGKLKVTKFVFEQPNSISEVLTKYLTKSNVNLLCIDRSEKSNVNTKLSTTNFKEIINQLNVNLLITGTTDFNLN